MTTGRFAKPTQKTFLEYPAQVTKEIASLDPARHLLQKATQLRLGVIADLPST